MDYVEECCSSDKGTRMRAIEKVYEIDYEKVIDKCDYDDVLVFIATNSWDSRVRRRAFEKIRDDNYDGLADVASYANDSHLAEDALVRIPDDNQNKLVDVARNTSHLEVRVEALGRISGDEFEWAQDELVQVAIDSWYPTLAEKALDRIPDDNQNKLVDVANNSRYLFVARKAFERIRLDGSEVWVDVARNSRQGPVAEKALERIGYANHDGLVDVAKNAYDPSVAGKALKRISINNQAGLIDVANNSRYLFVAERAVDKIRYGNQAGLIDVARNTSHLEVRVEALGRISGDEFEWAQDELVHVANNSRDLFVAWKAFERIRLDGSEVWVYVARNTSHLEVRVEALGRISGDEFEWAQDELVQVAIDSWDPTLAEKALDRIPDDNQAGLVYVARNTSHLEVRVEALGRISGDELEWAQSKLVSIAKKDYYYYYVDKALNRIRDDNYDGLADVASYANDPHLAEKALDRIPDYNQNKLVDVANNSRYLFVARKAFERIRLDGSEVWVDVARNSRQGPVAEKALERIGYANHDGLVDVAKNAYDPSVAGKALKRISINNQAGLIDVARNSRHSPVAERAVDMIRYGNQAGLIDVAINANLGSVSRKAVKRITDENLLKLESSSPIIDSEINRRRRAKEPQVKGRPQRSLNAKPSEIFEALSEYVLAGLTHEEAIVAVAGDYDVPRFKVSRLYRRNNWKDRLEFNQS